MARIKMVSSSPNTATPQYPDTSSYAHYHYAMPGGTERYLNLFARAISQAAGSFSYAAQDLDSSLTNAEAQTVLSAPDGRVIKAIAVDHGPLLAVAFRIEYKGHNVIYSGDTGSRGPNMLTISQDTDLLL